MQEEKEKREIPTPAILLTMLGQLNDKAFEKEAVLQCEESGANIAKLQGFLAGVRKYKTAHARKRLHRQQLEGNPHRGCYKGGFKSRAFR